MTKIIASTIIAVGIIASVGTAANAASFADTFFEQMQLNGK